MSRDPTTPNIERLIQELPRLPLPTPTGAGEERSRISPSDLQRRILPLAGLHPALIIQRLRDHFEAK
jgi:hypothetical protein